MFHVEHYWSFVSRELRKVEICSTWNISVPGKLTRHALPTLHMRFPTENHFGFRIE
jgi:hypothetical protein